MSVLMAAVSILSSTFVPGVPMIITSLKVNSPSYDFTVFDFITCTAVEIELIVAKLESSVITGSRPLL